MLKYGYNNFNLEILEYCDKNILIEREQYYIDLLKPEYNICKTAGSSLGRKFSIDTKLKISASLKGKISPCSCWVSCIIIIVNSLNNEVKVFKSMSTAAKYINYDISTFKRHLRMSKSFKKPYLIFSLDDYINNHKIK